MQALTNGYALFHLSVLVGLWIIWFGRPLRSALPIVVAWLVAAIPLVPELLKYREVHSALHLARDINEIKRLSVGVADLLSPSPELVLANWTVCAHPAHLDRTLTSCTPAVESLLAQCPSPSLPAQHPGDRAHAVRHPWSLIGIRARHPNASPEFRRPSSTRSRSTPTGPTVPTPFAVIRSSQG